MSDKRNGLYYESMDIRNHVLTRNIGKYRSYRHSLLENGGLAIGMPYAVETELVPYTLAQKSREGVDIILSSDQISATSRKDNPKITFAWREGGLFGYTHEIINDDYDWLSRNINIPESYYDYDSTEDILSKLNYFPNTLPWGESNDIIGGVESGGLRAFSSHNDPQNSVYYPDYTEYVRNIFTGGLSFDKSLSDHYITNLLYDGFSKENVDNGVTKFIDERSGYITDDIDSVLKPIEDTKLGYVGRVLLEEEKEKQFNEIVNRGVIYEHAPITNSIKIKLGLGTGNEDDYSAGISAYRDTEIEYERFIQDANDVLNGELDFQHHSFQEDLLRKHIRKNKYKDFSEKAYVKYYNVFEYNTHFDSNGNGEIDYDEEGNALSTTNISKDDLGYSVEGFFQGAGVFDGTVSQNEHYDERDTQSAGQRNSVTSEKISYDGIEYIGVDAGSGFSEKPNSLLSKTKALFDAHKIKTLVGRFHTSNDDRNAKNTSAIQTATDPTYGISHGRNLLKLTPTTENGYDNPYCRVWTYHHQYSKMTDLIRPFTEGGEFMDLDAIQSKYPGRPILTNAGKSSWSKKTVLNKNGRVNITPISKINAGAEGRVRAKQCMFSIENLAWKSINKSLSNIDDCEIGPLGGRIMWFPPYNLSFNESVSVNWGSNDFIGRGERIYSYTNTERTGSLSFTILADHPSILNYWINSEQRRKNGGTEEDQQKILRFFAGCENLEAEKMKQEQDADRKTNYYGLKEEDKPKDENERTDPQPQQNSEEKITPTPPDEFTKDNSIGFYVFFPNNLSGVDFFENPKVIVNYLINGRNGFDFNPNLDEDEKHHILPSSTETIGQWNDDTIINTSGPGYEMGRSEGTGLTDNVARVAIEEHNANKHNDNARDYLWGYGIDKKYVKQRLTGPNGPKKLSGNGSNVIYPKNYMDSTDFGLNKTPGDDACRYSFLDVAVALTTDYKYSGKGEVNDNVEKIKEILGIQDGALRNKNRKYYFAVAGGASVHGYVASNATLSQNRAMFVKLWLEYCFKKLNLAVDFNENANIPVYTQTAGGEDDLFINSLSAKRGRYAKAVIYWNDEEIKDATETDDTDTEASARTGVDKTVVEKPGGEVTQDEAAAAPTYINSVALSDYSSTRYRDEELFFSLVKSSDPVIFKNIVDKVKYFDPVFHSITPEGFNARLSFLHQCTRQGPTISSSDLSNNNGFNGAGYAGNLSFGRAPVCVLRLGDFFNTRIIINSVQIQYETAQWDLNPEGIGVQPMLANVTLSFVFQGGSSLGGPIQRLQNAVSFNYYANQEVYDDRADVAVYSAADEEGGTGEFDPNASLIWMPGYGTLNPASVNNAVEVMSANASARDAISQDKHQSIQAEQERNRKKGEERIAEEANK